MCEKCKNFSFIFFIFQLWKYLYKYSNPIVYSYIWGLHREKRPRKHQGWWEQGEKHVLSIGFFISSFASIVKLSDCACRNVFMQMWKLPKDRILSVPSEQKIVQCWLQMCSGLILVRCPLSQSITPPT